jgi:hypothetical protein
MKKRGVTCSVCRTGFCRLELCSQSGAKGEYHCPTCASLLEVLDGNHLVMYRLTVQPLKR